ncbi:MAG TPA: ABC transporter substrate-binding protein [Stellaceae bacterium]|jgi:multiple sugar transport system substrate-binding protein
MTTLSRRSIIRASLGLVAAGGLARPYIANAAATTATAWWVQGFIPEEDASFRKVVADYEKQSGNKIEYSIVPFAPLRQKIVSALTSGVVPDVIDATPPEVVPLQAWQGQLLDVGDIVATQKSEFDKTALEAANNYSNVEKRRGFYSVPYRAAVTPFHVWGSLIEKAGFKISDMPKTWDAFIEFFKPVQTKLREQGMRHTYATGFVVSTIGNDPTNTFLAFMIAYGGVGIVTRDGKLNSKDPQVREAVIKALERLSSLYKDGYIPPGSVNWNDADDNNAFHAKTCVMDYDGTISTEVAMFHDKQAYYNEVLTLPLPLSNEGKQCVAQYGIAQAIIPKGAKNIPVAKEFLTYLIQPKVEGELLKGGLGRSLPVFKSVVEKDSWWTDPKIDPHRPPYVKEGLYGPTKPDYYAFNPAWAQVRSEHCFNVAWADIVSGGMKPQDAADKAWRRIEAIFAKYPISEG